MKRSSITNPPTKRGCYGIPPPFVFYVYTHSQEPPLLPPADPKRPQSGSSNLIKVLRTKKLQITLTEVFKSKFKSHEIKIFYISRYLLHNEHV